jgi:CP family cyanate transporter-like MFS transporter
MVGADTAPHTHATASRASADEFGLSVGIACIIVVALVLRPGLVSIGPLLPAVRAQFHLSHAAAALLTSIPDLLLGLMALPTPWLARRVGRDRAIIGALILLGVSMVARSMTTTTATLLIATAGVGTGIAVAGALIGTFIKASFPKRGALMMGVYATSLSTGSTLSAALTGPIVRGFGDNWRYGAGLWGLLAIPALAAWLIVARRARGSVVSASATRHALPWSNPTAWMIALFFGCQNFLFYALISWTAPFYEEHGLSTTRSGFILASFTFAFMLANPVFGALSKSEDRRGWLALCASLGAVGMAFMAFAPLTAPFLYIPLGAIGMGGAFTLGMTLPLDNTHDAAEATSWNAFMLVVGYVIAATGPLLVGAIRDHLGSYTWAMAMLFAVTLAMLALTPFLHPHSKRAG